MGEKNLGPLWSKKKRPVLLCSCFFVLWHISSYHNKQQQAQRSSLERIRRGNQLRGEAKLSSRSIVPTFSMSGCAQVIIFLGASSGNFAGNSTEGWGFLKILAAKKRNWIWAESQLSPERTRTWRSPFVKVRTCKPIHLYEDYCNWKLRLVGNWHPTGFYPPREGQEAPLRPFG